MSNKLFDFGSMPHWVNVGRDIPYYVFDFNDRMKTPKLIEALTLRFDTAREAIHGFCEQHGPIPVSLQSYTMKPGGEPRFKWLYHWPSNEKATEQLFGDFMDEIWWGPFSWGRKSLKPDTPQIPFDELYSILEADPYWCDNLSEADEQIEQQISDYWEHIISIAIFENSDAKATILNAGGTFSYHATDIQASIIVHDPKVATLAKLKH